MRTNRINVTFVLVLILGWGIRVSCNADVTTPQPLAVGQTYRLLADAHTGDEGTTEPKTDANDGLNGDSPYFRRHNVARAHIDYWYTSNYQGPGEPDPNGEQWVDYVPPLTILGAGTYSIEAKYRNNSNRATYEVPYTVHHAGGSTTILKSQRSGPEGYNSFDLGTYDLGSDGWVRVEDPGPNAVDFHYMRFTYVDNCTPPVVLTQQPAPAHVCPGMTVIFSVTATGSSLSYQWQKNSVNLSDGESISGVHTTTLEIANAQGTHNGNYRCVVIGDCGTVTSNNAALTVSSQPAISQQPQAQHVPLGQTAVFTVTASGGGTVAYQWQKDGAALSNGGDISGANAAQIQIAGAGESDQGNYRCIVTDDCGSTTSNPAALTISYEIELFRDDFDTSPCGRWGIYYDDWSDAGCTVYHATDYGDGCGRTPQGYAYRHYDGNRWMVREDFTTGDAPNLLLTFAYRNDTGASITAQAKQNGTWTNLLTVGTAASWTHQQVALSGTVTGLRFRLVGGSEQARRLDCVSIVGELECTPPVVITRQPASIAVCPSTTAAFSIEATGSSLTYQWQKDGANLSDGGNISGVNTSVLEITDTGVADTGNYGCIVSGDCGVKISNAVPLSVSLAPTITQQPQTQHVASGTTAVFSVAATGGGTISYQWQKDGTNLSNGGNISGAYAAQLQISDASNDDQGNYRCVVTDDCGSVTSNPATLTISYEVELFRDNFNASACDRWSIFYDNWTDAGCTVYHETGLQDACGSPPGYAYRQYAGNRWMVREDFTTAGYTNLVLTFWYRNDSGASLEAWAKQNGSWSQVANVGAAGSWTQHQVGLSGTVTGLRFRFVAGSDVTRRLDCVSIAGELECTPPVVITQQPAALAVCPRGTAAFSVTATGSSLTYQWQRNGANLFDGGDIAGTTTPLLEIANADSSDIGNYGCVVNGDCGTKISDPAQLMVSAAPTVLQQPRSLEECEGNTATFSISVLGAGAVYYQWQKNGFDLTDAGRISGTASTTLRIAGVEESDEGVYQCTVLDDCGATISNSVGLTVVGTCLGTSTSEHYVTYRGKSLMLIGDSGTQCAAQNTNLNYREWIDDCHARGIRMVHLWSFMSPRQKQDGSVIESRWGYVYPGVTPWARHTSGALANDQLYRWNLRAFDDGPDGATNHYWPRMRDLCAYAKSKDMIVGYTVFTGWIKGNHDAWTYHPFNVANGGHLSTNLPDGVTIASPGTEVWQETWSDAWPNAKKTQWVWEHLSIKAINDLGGFGNVFFVFFDEHSYDEGNMGNHFRDFFRGRGQVWTDWNNRRSTIDWVMSPTDGSTDKNTLAIGGFNGSPIKPYLFLEGDPYMGDSVRTAIWTFSIGGGHYTFHGDAGQETERTGIMGYDPYVPGGDKGMYKRDWMGHASRLFNEHVEDLDSMAPRNDLCDSGNYCLATPGREYVVYSKIGASTTFNVNLGGSEGKTLDCRFYNPRNGSFQANFQRTGGGVQSFNKPDSNDWALHIVRQIQPPDITLEPQSQMQPLGGTATFVLQAVGEGVLSYQWQQNGINLGNDERINGATAATLQIVSLQPGDAGEYRCVVSNAAGATTSTIVTLTIVEEQEGEGEAVEGESMEGEGESVEGETIEGEGEVPFEGEGEVPAEGEGEPAEGEGEVPAEGEGEPAEGEPVEGEEVEGETESEGEIDILHPADLNRDWRIVISEAIAYLAGWQLGSNPIAYAIRAAYLWQNGELYLYDAGQAPPLCWVLSP